MPALIRFGRQSRNAAEELAVFLDGYHQRLLYPNGLHEANQRGGSRNESHRHHRGYRQGPSAPSPKPCAPASTAKRESSASKKSPSPKSAHDEVLIKVAACGICGTDIKKIFQRYVEPPQILGHELAGTVVAVGPGVTKWKPGDRVMSFHHTPCGTCFYCEKRLFSQCKQYKTTGLTAGFTPNGGGFGEYVKAMPWVAERGIVALPDNVSFEEATFIEPINTIVKAVQKARVAPGETVLVLGCGPIGLQLLMVSKLQGAKLYTSDPIAERRAKSLTLGALESFDPTNGKLVEDIKARTGGPGGGCGAGSRSASGCRDRCAGGSTARWTRFALCRERPGYQDRVSRSGSGDRRKRNPGQLQRRRRHPRSCGRH